MDPSFKSIPDYSGPILLALLLANASVILFMPSFITVDGPMHILRASVIEADWTMPRYCAEGIGYDEAVMVVRLGDLVRMVLLHFTGPEQAEALLAALVSAALVLAVYGFLRAYGVRANSALVWLAPIGFNFILIMGFVDFILGVALSFAVAALCETYRDRRAWRWAILSCGMVGAWYTHHGAPVLLGSLILASMVFIDNGGAWPVPAGRSGTLERWAIALGLLAVMAAILAWVLQRIPSATEPMRILYGKGFLLRPLLLFDAAKEDFVLSLLGVLLGVTLAASIWARWRSGRKWLMLDNVLLLALCFAALPFLYETKSSRLLYVPERCQWLALLFFVVWVVSVADAARGLPYQVIVTVAWAAVPLHAVRLHEAHAVFAGLERAQALTKEAVVHLTPGSLVVPVMAESNWLLRHLGGLVAVHHDGICLTRSENLPYRIRPAPDSTARSAPLLLESPPTWLPLHWETGEAPVVDHILFIGTDDSVRSFWQAHWEEMMARHYRPTFDNGYVTIYTAAQGPAETDPPPLEGVYTAFALEHQMVVGQSLTR